VREIAQEDYDKLKKQLLSGIRRNRLLTAVGIGVLMQIIKEDYYKSSCDRLEILRSQGTLF
jgi:hypothetical protein